MRIRLGLFDPPAGQPDYSNPDLVGSPKYHALSLDASRQAMTLLSNPKQTLPLTPGKRIAVIGANAETKTLLAGGTGGGLLSAQVVCKNATNRTDWTCVSSPFEAISAMNDAAGGSTTVSKGGKYICNPPLLVTCRSVLTDALACDFSGVAREYKC